MTVDAHFRERVAMVADRLGCVRLVVSERWTAFAAELLLGNRVVEHTEAAALVIGTPADVLRHAEADTNEFGFVMPVAQMAKPWQRSTNWRDDATMALWRAGWSPLDLDRLLVAGDDATVEFVIGNARRIPATAAT